jgi:hypothetical protein
MTTGMPCMGPMGGRYSMPWGPTPLPPTAMWG